MTNKQKEEGLFARIMGKATRNGFNTGHSLGVYPAQILYGEMRNEKGEITGHTMPTLYQIIFSHDFAKAFWKEEEEEIDWKTGLDMWQYHLSQMVLEEEPLKYLEQFLEEI